MINKIHIVIEIDFKKRAKLTKTLKAVFVCTSAISCSNRPTSPVRLPIYCWTNPERQTFTSMASLGQPVNLTPCSETRKQRRKLCEKAGHYPLFFFFFFSEKCVFLKSWISIINLVWIHSHIRASYFDYLSTFNIFIFSFIKKVTTCKMILTGTSNKNKSK